MLLIPLEITLEEMNVRHTPEIPVNAVVAAAAEHLSPDIGFVLSDLSLIHCLF